MSADGLKDVVSESGINMVSHSNKKRSPLAGEINRDEFLSISFSHHI